MNEERNIEKSSKKDLTISAPIANIKIGGVCRGVCFFEIIGVSRVDFYWRRSV
jgi:hypothetical protein